MVFGRRPSRFMAPFVFWRVMAFCWWNVTHSKGLSNDSWTCIRTPSKNEDVFFLDWHCGWEVPQNEYIVIFHHHHHHQRILICYIDQLLPIKAVTFTPHPSANCSPAPGRHLAAHRCDLAQRLLRTHPASSSERMTMETQPFQRCGDFLKWWVSPT